MTDEQGAYFLDDVIKILGCSRDSFERWRKEGKLWWLHELQPRLGRPRYRASDVADYLAGRIEVRTRPYFTSAKRRA